MFSLNSFFKRSEIERAQQRLDKLSNLEADLSAYHGEKSATQGRQIALKAEISSMKKVARQRFAGVFGAPLIGGIAYYSSLDSSARKEAKEMVRYAGLNGLQSAGTTAGFLPSLAAGFAGGSVIGLLTGISLTHCLSHPLLKNRAMGIQRARLVTGIGVSVGAIGGALAAPVLLSSRMYHKNKDYPLSNRIVQAGTIVGDCFIGYSLFKEMRPHLHLWREGVNKERFVMLLERNRLRSTCAGSATAFGIASAATMVFSRQIEKERESIK